MYQPLAGLLVFLLCSVGFIDVVFAEQHDSDNTILQTSSDLSDKDTTVDNNTLTEARLPKNPRRITFERQWKSYVGFAPSFRDYRWRVAQDSDNLYTISKQGTIYVLDKQSGDRIRRIKLDIDLNAGVTLVADHLLLGSVSGELIAYDLTNDQIDWRVTLYAETLHPPVSDGRVVLVKTNDGQLWSIDFATGIINWTTVTKNPPLTTRALSEPLIEAGAIFGTFETGKVAIIHPRNGVRVWETSLGENQSDTEIDRLTDIDAAPVIVQRRLFVAGLHSAVQAFALTSDAVPEQIWRVPFSTHQNFQADATSLYLVSDRDIVTALRQQDGSIHWINTELSWRKLTAPLLWKSYVVVADGKGYAFALDQQNGELLGYQRASPAAIQTYLVADENQLYVLDNSGFMSAYTINQAID